MCGSLGVCVVVFVCATLCKCVSGCERVLRYDSESFSVSVRDSAWYKICAR